VKCTPEQIPLLNYNLCNEGMSVDQVDMLATMLYDTYGIVDIGKAAMN